MRKLWLTFSILVFSGCPGSQPIPDAGPACPALTGTPVVHQADVTAAETWAGDGAVHQVNFSLTVRPGVTLTVAPCAVVKVKTGVVMTVEGASGNPAKLVSQGTASQPVLFTNTTPGEKWGSWRGMNADSTMDLAYTTFENAGGALNGALALRGLGLTEKDVIPVLKADHLVIKDSKSTGLYLESGAAFVSGSTEITITGGGGVDTGPNDYAMEISPIAAGTIPKVNFSGNAKDAIKIYAGTQTIARDLTLKNLGVPYYFFFDRVRVTDPTGAVTPTLTLEPGVELRFDDYLLIGTVSTVPTQPGKLIAVGTV